MTKTQLRKKFKELQRNNNKSMMELFERALKSGALELSNYDDNYILPKIIIHAILLGMVDQWRPLIPEFLRESKNLSHFL